MPKQIRKMTREEIAAFMADLKAKLDAGEIDRDELERRRAPVKAEIERRMFAR